MERITCLSLWLGGMIAPAFSAEPPPPEDHPFAIVTFASVDRLRARATSLGEAIGDTEFSEKWIASGFMGDESMGMIFNSPGFDPTRPIGIMSYPKWFPAEVDTADSSEGNETDATETPQPPALQELFENPFELLVSGFMENATVVFCFPAKDREQLLATISRVAGETFQPIAGRPGWFGNNDDDMRITFVGRYVLLVADDGKVKQWDRNYPDFEKLAKASLGQHGFAYTLNRRGLPKLVREDMAESFKLAHAATLQRQDDEPEVAFKLRTMFGLLTTESLDLLLSHIDEFRITGHVDSNTHQILVDTELIGPKDGKLAKFANALTAKSSPFASLSTDDAIFAATVSLPLSQKLWKPVVESARLVGEAAGENIWLAGLMQTLAKTIEAGQLELHTSYTREGEGLFVLRVAGNGQFPEHVQAALEAFGKLQGDGAVTLAADSVENLPIHRVRASMFDSVGFGLFDWTDLTPDEGRRVGTAKVLQKNADGVDVEVGETLLAIPLPESDPQSYLWVCTTPKAIWVALSSPQKRECPAWFKAAVAESVTKPKGTATAGRSPAPVRVMLRGWGASPAARDSGDDNPENAPVIQAAAQAQPAVKGNVEAGKTKPLPAQQLVLQVEAEQLQRQEQLARERGDLLRDGDNAIQIELRPTSTGLRLRTTFDEAYFRWFALMMKHELDE